MGSLDVFNGSGHLPDVDSLAFQRSETSLDHHLEPLHFPAERVFLEVLLPAWHD